MLGRADDGLINSVVVVCIADKAGKEDEADTIFNFANKAYDAGIQERIIIAPFDFLLRIKTVSPQNGILKFSMSNK